MYIYVSEVIIKSITYFLITFLILCVPEKRKPINRVNFSENGNDLSEKVYTVTKFSLSSLIRHLKIEIALTGLYSASQKKGNP